MLDTLLTSADFSDLSDAEAAALLNAPRSELLPNSMYTWVGIERALGATVATAAKAALLQLGELAPNVIQRARVQLIDQQLSVGVDFGTTEVQEQLTLLEQAGVDAPLIQSLRSLGVDNRPLSQVHRLGRVSDFYAVTAEQVAIMRRVLHIRRIWSEQVAPHFVGSFTVQEIGDLTAFRTGLLAVAAALEST